MGGRLCTVKNNAPIDNAITKTQNKIIPCEECRSCIRLDARHHIHGDTARHLCQRLGVERIFDERIFLLWLGGYP